MLSIFSYAKLGLQKLGISPDLLTSDLLHSATAMTERWKDVVTFYTLRLSLAPVVETLILLDRMMFLHEHGRLSQLFRFWLMHLLIMATPAKAIMVVLQVYQTKEERHVFVIRC